MLRVERRELHVAIDSDRATIGPEHTTFGGVAVGQRRVEIDDPSVDLILHLGEGQQVEHALSATHDVDQFVALAENDRGTIDDEVRRGQIGADVVAQITKHLAHRFEANAGVERLFTIRNSRRFR